MAHAATTGPAHRRDPDAHRAAILQAAREAFTQRGYARATIRDIARRAGVTHGLVMRHFKSKEQLMLAAFPGRLGLEVAVPGDPATLPERITHLFVDRLEGAPGEDPLIAIIRSAATNEQAAATLYDEMRRRSVDALRDVLPPEAFAVCGDLIVAIFIGVTFERWVIGAGGLAELPPAALEAHVAGLVRQVLKPYLPGSEPQ